MTIETHIMLTVAPRTPPPLHTALWSLLLGLVLTLGVASMLLAQPAPANAEVIDRIVAKINDEIITLHDLRRAVGPYVLNLNRDPDELNNPEFARQIYGDVLDDMINTRLLLQQAEELQLKISDDDVTRWIAGIASRQGLRVETFRAAIKAKGVGWQDYRRYVHDNLLKYRVIQLKVGSRIKITDEELRKAYIDRYGTEPKGVRTLSLNQILIRIDEENPEKAKKAIDQAYQRLEDGDDFADVARDMSMASSAPEGGFIGDSFRRGELPKAIEEAVFKLKDGEHTEPLLGRSGYNIFKANASRFTIDETTQRKLDALRERLFEQEMNNGLTVMIEGLRKRAYIDMMLSR